MSKHGLSTPSQHGSLWGKATRNPQKATRATNIWKGDENNVKRNKHSSISKQRTRKCE